MTFKDFLNEYNKKYNKNPNYEFLSERNETINGISFQIIRIKCKCCNSLLDYYYPINMVFNTAIKIEVIKRGK